MAEAQPPMLPVHMSSASASFRSNGKRIGFPGFFRGYVEGSDEPDAALEGQEVMNNQINKRIINRMNNRNE